MSLDVMLDPHFVLHENTSQFSMGIKQLIRHHCLGAFLLNNTNFSSEAHAPAPQYGHYVTQAMDNCFVLMRLISMA